MSIIDLAYKINKPQENPTYKINKRKVDPTYEINKLSLLKNKPTNSQIEYTYERENQ